MTYPAPLHGKKFLMAFVLRPAATITLTNEGFVIAMTNLVMYPRAMKMYIELMKAMVIVRSMKESVGNQIAQIQCMKTEAATSTNANVKSWSVKQRLPQVNIVRST